jgi:hypothetical protein
MNKAAEEVDSCVDPTSTEPEKETEGETSSRNGATERNEAIEGTVPEEETKLPPLSPSDFKVYNSMAEQMDYFVRALSTPISILKLTNPPAQSFPEHMEPSLWRLRE